MTPVTPVTDDDEDDELDLGMRMALGGLIGALFGGRDTARDRLPREPSAPVEIDSTTRETRDL